MTISVDYRSNLPYLQSNAFFKLLQLKISICNSREHPKYALDAASSAKIYSDFIKEEPEFVDNASIFCRYSYYFIVLIKRKCEKWHQKLMMEKNILEMQMAGWLRRAKQLNASKYLKKVWKPPRFVRKNVNF